MQLMRLKDMPETGRDRLYRYSPVRAAAGFLIVIAFCAGLVLFGVRNDSIIPYFIATIIFVFLLMFLRLLTARFRPSNWLVRMTDSGLYVQFRSYLNYHFSAEDPAVVLIPYSEIRSARLVRQVQRTPGERNRTQTKINRLVELELSGDTSELEQALATERARKAPKDARWYGSSSTTFRHYPVSVVSGALRLEWGVVPRGKVFVNDLRKYTAIAPPVSVQQEQDYVNLDKLSREQQEEKLLELAEKGDTITAIKIARELYSYNLAEAKAFVEGLITNKGG